MRCEDQGVSAPFPSSTSDHLPDKGHSRFALWLKTGLLCVWFLVSFVASFFARDLQFMVAGWPFHYWMGAQGALVTFVVIVALYAWLMNRIPSENRDVQDGDHGL